MVLTLVLYMYASMKFLPIMCEEFSEVGTGVGGGGGGEIALAPKLVEELFWPILFWPLGGETSSNQLMKCARHPGVGTWYSRDTILLC